MLLVEVLSDWQGDQQLPFKRTGDLNTEMKKSVFQKPGWDFCFLFLFYYSVEATWWSSTVGGVECQPWNFSVCILRNSLHISVSIRLSSPGLFAEPSVFCGPWMLLVSSHVELLLILFWLSVVLAPGLRVLLNCILIRNAFYTFIRFSAS